MELDKDKCLVTLLEGKNASSGKLPSEKLFKWAYSDEIDMGDEEGDVANYTFKTDDNRTFVINFN